MNDPQFFVCAQCGSVMELLNDNDEAMECCGEPFALLRPGASDGAAEKHVPVVKVQGNTVKVQVGSVPHPMLPEHHIGWIWLQTALGGQRRVLAAGDAPEAEFMLAAGDTADAAWAWCNLHGLWKASI